jgi:glycosyltransferase involved in cell wall biosynthesis
MMTAPDDAFHVTALMSAYNEADVIAQVIGDLISQGVDVYLLDDGSTDTTVREAETFLGRGLRGIERLPPSSEGFDLSRILRRKEELASTVDSNWFLNVDADELRESPWEGCNLREAILRVDRLGFDVVDFAVFNFRPTHDRFAPGDDLRQSFLYYEPGEQFDRLQLRCWKNRHRPIDLVSSGGHDVKFDRRRVFPLRFVLRHYPLRSQAHGERKVFQERRPRFLPAERERGWHVQYDKIEPGHRFLRAADELIQFDLERERVNLQAHNRLVEAL